MTTARARGIAFVVGVAILVMAAGYQFAIQFPDQAARNESDRYNAWLQVSVFAGTALLLLWDTPRWTWLSRSIVWLFIGLTSLFLILASRWPSWSFFQSLEWLWSARFMVTYAAVVYAAFVVADRVDRMRSANGGSITHRLTPNIPADRVLGAIVAAKPMVIASSDGTIRYVTKSVADLVGAPVDTIEGKNLRVIIPSRFHVQHNAGLARFLETGTGPLMNHVVRAPMLRADGTEVPVYLALTHATVAREAYLIASLWPAGNEIVIE